MELTSISVTPKINTRETLALFICSCLSAGRIKVLLSCTAPGSTTAYAGEMLWKVDKMLGLKSAIDRHPSKSRQEILHLLVGFCSMRHYLLWTCYVEINSQFSRFANMIVINEKFHLKKFIFCLAFLGWAGCFNKPIESKATVSFFLLLLL